MQPPELGEHTPQQPRHDSRQMRLSASRICCALRHAGLGYTASSHRAADSVLADTG
ncbi:hypothetical protein PCI56_13140 [Plesiomonas shigelloides subsp. oncorhynchi]|nr:hypothetical protein [Plesiomonas shigelloides]